MSRVAGDELAGIAAVTERPVRGLLLLGGLADRAVRTVIVGEVLPVGAIFVAVPRVVILVRSIVDLEFDSGRQGGRGHQGDPGESNEYGECRNSASEHVS